MKRSEKAFFSFPQKNGRLPKKPPSRIDPPLPFKG
jgi:hypothetical protein